MDDLTFKSRFSKEEIEENFKEYDLFSELMDALNEALAIEKEEAKNNKERGKK